MIDIGPTEDWEIWAGSSLALLVPKADSDKPWLTRAMSLKYQMPGVTERHAHLVFEKAMARGYLIPLHAVPPQHQPKEDTDAP